jgi:hypothetical protein
VAEHELIYGKPWAQVPSLKENTNLVAILILIKTLVYLRPVQIDFHKTLHGVLELNAVLRTKQSGKKKTPRG